MTPASAAALPGISVCAQVLQNENSQSQETIFRGDVGGHKSEHWCGGSTALVPKANPQKNKILPLQSLQKRPGKKGQGRERAKHFSILFFRTHGEIKGKEIANHQQKSRRGKARPWGYQQVLPLDHREQHK